MAEGCFINGNPKPELKRITFYDVDSKLVQKKVSEKETIHYLKEIKKDIAYFGKTFRRAHLVVDIAGLSIEQSVSKVQEAVLSYELRQKARLPSAAVFDLTI